MKCKNMKSFQTGVDIKENEMPKIRDYLAIFVKNTERRIKIKLYLIFTAIVGVNINQFGSLKVPVIRSQYGTFSPNPRITSPAQHRQYEVSQIFTFVSFDTENFSQIFVGYEFTPKINSQI